MCATGAKLDSLDALKRHTWLSLEYECVYVRLPRPNTSFQFLFEGLTESGCSIHTCAKKDKRTRKTMQEK